MKQDKRKDLRVSKHIALKLCKKKLVFLKSSESAGQVLDISKTGMRLFTTLKLISGDLVAITIKSGFVVLGDFNGKVIWTQEVRKDAEIYTKAGIEFKKLNIDQKNYLMEISFGTET